MCHFATEGEAPLPPTMQLLRPTPEAQKASRAAGSTHCRLDAQIITQRETVCFSHISTVQTAPQRAAEPEA
jgi:hypothetical protein